MYSPLHWHSTFSFLEAIGTPKQIISKAQELGLQHIAITDFGGMYWAISFYESAKKAGINPIVGTELWFVLDINGYNKVENIGNICLLAKNSQWYSSLMKFVSHANQEWIVGKAKVDVNMLDKYNEWIIAFMWWKDSWIGKMIISWESDEKITEIIDIIASKIWKENVYLEIIAQNEANDNDTQKVNTKILELSQKLSIDCIINNIYHYLNKSDKKTWEMALAIKDGKKMYEEDRRKPNWEFHIMNWDEIMWIMTSNGYTPDQVWEWLNNNNNIAKEISIDIKMGQALFPNYQTPEDIQKIYDWVKDDLISE